MISPLIKSLPVQTAGIYLTTITQQKQLPSFSPLNIGSPLNQRLLDSHDIRKTVNK